MMEYSAVSNSSWGDDPFLLQLRQGKHPEQDCLLRLAGFRIPKGQEIAEGKGLLTVDGIGVGAGDVDGGAQVFHLAGLVSLACIIR